MKFHVRYQLTANSQIQTRYFDTIEEANADVKLMIGRDRVYFAKVYRV